MKTKILHPVSGTRSLQRALLLTLCLSALLVLRLKGQPILRNELTLPGSEIWYANCSVLHHPTPDSGMITIYQTSVNNSWYIYIVKTSYSGATQWAKRMTSLAAFGEVVPTADGGYLFCYTELYSYFVIHLDAAGNTVYSRKINVPAPYMVQGRPTQIIPRGNGNCYIVGDVMDTSVIEEMWHVMELDANGSPIWSHTYHQGAAKSYHCDADTCANGDIVVLGMYWDIPALMISPLVTRIAPGGNVVWSKYYTVPSISLIPKSLVVMPGDEIVVASVPQSFGPLTNLLRLDGQGNVLWDRQFFRASNYIIPNDVMEAENGCTVVWGSSQGSGYMMKNDASGNLVALHDYPNADLHAGHTAAGQRYSASGVTTSGSGIITLTTDLAGYSCNDSVFSVTQNIFNIAVTPRSSDMVMPTVASTFVPAFTSVSPSFPVICNATGIAQHTLTEYEVYPVPATENVFIRSASVIDELVVTDLQGRCVYRSKPAANSAQLNVSTLEAGLYVITIASGDKIATVKIPVQH